MLVPSEKYANDPVNHLSAFPIVGTFNRMKFRYVDILYLNNFLTMQPSFANCYIHGEAFLALGLLNFVSGARLWLFWML